MKCPIGQCRHQDSAGDTCCYCRLCRGLCHDSGHRSYDVYGAELKLEMIGVEPTVVCRAFEVIEGPREPSPSPVWRLRGCARPKTGRDA